MMHTDLDAKEKLFRFKIGFTCAVSMFVIALLLWEHYHGGVQSHHILHNQDLPAISNWWSGLILPSLAWFLSGRVEKRLLVSSSESSIFQAKISSAIKLALVGLAFGLLLAISFTFDFRPFLDNILYILLLLSLIFPIYFSEFIIGFVLGMTFTFGAILPTLFIAILAGVGFMIFRFIRPMVIKLINSLGR